MTLRILLLGCGDVGSAVAYRLFLQGADVVLADVQAPAHPRRSMAFTDAWFDGTATLDGVVAQWMPEMSARASTLAGMDAIAGTCAAPSVAAAALRPHALVDARMRKRTVPEDLRSLAPVVVGLGPGFTPGRNCTVAIETAWGDRLGDVLRGGPASPLSGELRALGGAGRERFVYAEEAGRWSTRVHIGATVISGALIGRLGSRPVHAPLSGVLRGLTRDGVTVQAGQKLVEVDPGVQPGPQGLGARPSAVARGVARALGLPIGLDAAFFGFEAEFCHTLDCIPMSMRAKLDGCGLKPTLEQWRELPRPLREVLLEMPVDTPRGVARVSQMLRRRGQQLGWPSLPTVRADNAVADSPGAARGHGRALRCAADHHPPLALEAWALLTPLQRYALVKLTGSRSGKNWHAAWVEFGLHRG